MADFQLPEDIISQVKEHANLESPRECCGVIIIKKGKRYYKPCTNISQELDHFVIDPLEFSRLSMQGDIEFIVHSHVDGNSPSEHDITICNTLKIPYLIYYLSDDTYSTIFHNNYNKLSGRQYIFGKQDCFEAARDWFLVHKVVMPPRRKWLDNWWEHGYNYIENEVLNWPVRKVNSPVYGDILTLKINGNIPNHIAIYLDNDVIFHHAVNRLSCRENMYPLWGESIHGIYRYEGSSIRRVFW